MTDEEIFELFCDIAETLENLADACYNRGECPETVETIDMLTRDTRRALREWQKEITR